METNGDRSLIRGREPDLEAPLKDHKRPREDDNDMPSAKKKAKRAVDDEVVIIEGDDLDNGAITIDDD